MGACVILRHTLQENVSLGRLKKIDTANTEWQSMLRGIVEKCVAVGPVKAMYVFGSFAENQMTEESDLDIAVVLANGQDAKIYRSKLPHPLCTWPTDLIVVSEARFDERKNFGGVLADVFHDGIELYPDWKLVTSHDDT